MTETIYDSDYYLLERMRLDSDKEAYCSLYSKYYPILVAYAEMFVCLEDAEDVVQDHLLRLWTRRDELGALMSLKAFLFACVRNSCLDKLRRSKSHGSRVTELWENLAEAATDCGCYQISEIRQIIRKALDELPLAQRRAFELNRFEDMTYHNIAAIMGVSQKTVEYRISKALAKLTSALSDYLP